MSDTPSVSAKAQPAVKSAKVGDAAKAPAIGDELQHRIAVAAYYRAERRNFEPGGEMKDWLDAEAEVLAELESLKGLPA